LVGVGGGDLGVGGGVSRPSSVMASRAAFSTTMGLLWMKAEISELSASLFTARG
jgi:hypothetical protein